MIIYFEGEDVEVVFEIMFFIVMEYWKYFGYFIKYIVYSMFLVICECYSEFLVWNVLKLFFLLGFLGLEDVEVVLVGFCFNFSFDEELEVFCE